MTSTSPSPTSFRTCLTLLAAFLALLATACSSDTPAADTQVAAVVEEADDHDHDEDADHGEDDDHDDDHEHDEDDDHDHDGESSISLVSGESDLLSDYVLIDEGFGTEVTVTVTDGTRTIEANALPNHETGEFPNSGNPNEIRAQSLSYEFTTEPVYAGTATFAHTPGVALNGVSMEPGTAETATCAAGETYRVEALQEFIDLGSTSTTPTSSPAASTTTTGSLTCWSPRSMKDKISS